MKALLSLLLFFSLLAAETQTRKTYYPDGLLKSATTYKNGRKNGAEHIYYPDGATLKYSRVYEYDKLHGLQQEYGPDALLIKEESYSHGRLDGVSRYYHNGLLQKELEYRNGYLDGMYREFYPSGLVKVEIRLRRGIPEEGYIYDETGRRKAMSPEDMNKYIKKERNGP